MRFRAVWQFAFAVAVSFSLPLCFSVTAADCGNSPYECAVAYVQQGNFQAAIRSLTSVLQQSPRDLKAMNLLGIALTESGQPKKGDEQFQAALAVDPSFYPARKNWAVKLFDEKRCSDAAVQFTRVLQQAPGDPIAHLYLGEVSFDKKDCAGALKHYEAGRAQIAKKSRWLMHDAQCHLAEGDSEKAVAVLRMLPESDAADGMAMAGPDGPHTARRGETIGVTVLFSGMQLADDLSADVSYDIKVTAPDGKVDPNSSQSGVAALKDKIPGRFNVLDSRSTLSIHFEPEDKPGPYRIDVLLRDNIGGKKVALSRSIELLDK